MNNLTLLKCICDQTRYEVLTQLKKNPELCVNDIVKKLKKDQPLVSHHLRALKNCGIVKSRDSGKKTMYSLANKETGKLIDSIDAASKKIVNICDEVNCC